MANARRRPAKQKIFPIRITGKTTADGKPHYDTKPDPAGPLVKGQIHMVKWINKSDVDMLVCTATDNSRSFMPTFFFVPKGGHVISGPLRCEATGASQSEPTGHKHEYNFAPDPPDKPVEDCGGRIGPKHIIVQ